MKNSKKTFSELPAQSVAVERIETGTGPCCMSFGYDAGPLIRSIRQVDLIHAPLLMEGDSDRLLVVAGYRRIHALMALNRGNAPCRVLEKKDLTPLEALLINLHDNLSTRAFNEVEKGMILERLFITEMRV